MKTLWTMTTVISDSDASIVSRLTFPSSKIPGSRLQVLDTALGTTQASCLPGMPHYTIKFMYNMVTSVIRPFCN